MSFVEALSEQLSFAAIPFNLRDHLELVERTGRCVRHDKKGFISANITPIPKRLGLSDAEWQLLALAIQKESIAMLNGLEKVAAPNQRRARRKAA